MTIYEVWDRDPMDDTDYIAKRFTAMSEAQAEADRRNLAWRRRFESNATDGIKRAASETWNWQHAYVKEGRVG